MNPTDINLFSESERYILIAKYLAGEATPEEAMALHDWLREPANQEEFGALKKLWQQAGGVPERTEFNPLQAWRGVERTLRKPVPMKSRRWVYGIAVAASLAFAVVGLFLFLQPSKGVDKDANALAAIHRSATNDMLFDTLADGSTVIVNRNSRIDYAIPFSRTERAISLKGEAFFSVAPNREKPFRISVGELMVEVVGTEFNVKEENKENAVIVQVASGVVKLSAAQKSVLVKKGQTGIYYRQRQAFMLAEGIGINSISYATRSFSFRDLPLKEVAAYLEHAFSIKIAYDEASFSSCRITAEFHQKPLGYILDVIAITLNAHYTQNGQIVLLEGQGCE